MERVEEADLEAHLVELKNTLGHRFSGDPFFAGEAEELRGALVGALGLSDRAASAPQEVTSAGERRRDGFTEHKVYLRDDEGVRVPVYFLEPDQPRQRDAVILVFHGHNPNVQYCLGNYPDEATAQRFRAKDNHYAEALAVAGYRVAAVEQRGFGERLTARAAPIHDNTVTTSCRDLAFQYLTVGRTLAGERVRDGQLVMEWLRKEGWQGEPVRRLGVTGNSGGGTTAFWLGIVDQRADVAVIGSAFCGFRESILALSHCDCNYIPGILKICDMGSAATLFAPRPLCFVHGAKDPIFPITSTREQFAEVERAYGAHGAPERCLLAEHPGFHAYNNALAHAWWDKWLGANDSI